MKKDKKLYNMNKKTKLFLLMNIGNYVLVLLAFLGFRLGAGISVIFFLFCQPALVFVNYYVSQRILQLAVLSGHLLISTIITWHLSSYRDNCFISMSKFIITHL